MISQHLSQVQSVLQGHGILICFSGRLTQGVIEEYGEAVKTYLENEERPKTEVFNVFSIYIEQSQNIKNYCSSKAGSQHYEKIIHSSIITIGKSEEGYYICSGNLIEQKDAEQLRERMDLLQQSDKAALKLLYKNVLKSEQPEGSSNAGLGLIDMARKAKGPLEYVINPVDDAMAFFTLKAMV